jgi:hypothetical protein
LSFGVSLIETFAFRAIAIDDASLGQSIELAFKAVKGNLGQVLGIGIILGIILLVIAFLVMVPLSPLLQALMAPRLAAVQECVASYGQDVGALQDCMAQFLASQGVFNDLTSYGLGIVAAVLGSLGTTYVSAVGTLLYQAIADKSVLKVSA